MLGSRAGYESDRCGTGWRNCSHAAPGRSGWPRTSRSSRFPNPLSLPLCLSSRWLPLYSMWRDTCLSILSSSWEGRQTLRASSRLTRATHVGRGLCSRGIISQFQSVSSSHTQGVCHDSWQKFLCFEQKRRGPVWTSTFGPSTCGGSESPLQCEQQPMGSIALFPETEQWSCSFPLNRRLISHRQEGLDLPVRRVFQ